MKLESPGINGEGTKIFHNFLIIITDVFTVQEIIKPEIVQKHGNGKPRPLTILLVVQVLPHTVTHLTHHITPLHNLTHSHQPATNTVNPLCMFKHRPSTLLLHIFNQTYTKLLPRHLHKITKMNGPVNRKVLDRCRFGTTLLMLNIVPSNTARV